MSPRAKPARAQPARARALSPALLLCSLALTGDAAPAAAQPAPAASARDGQRDFDFEIGTWRTHLRRRLRPLTGSNEWAEYTGTSVVRKVWGGRANLVELTADGPAGRIQALSLRLYDPAARQWSLNFASARSGTMSGPVYGQFVDGRGVFHGQESLDGRMIYVRFVVTDITPTSCRFEQSFSADGGKTWELNWVATDTRVKGGRRGTGR